MKKLLLIVLCVSVLISNLIIPAMAATASVAEVCQTTQNVWIGGQLTEGSWNRRLPYVTICLRDNTTGDVAYLQQCNIESDGKYELKFKYNGDLTGHTLYVNEGGKDVADTVTIREITDNLTKYDLNLTNASGYENLRTNDIAKLVVNITNKFGNAGKYKMVLAFYDEIGRLSNCEFIDKDLKFDINSKSELISNLEILKNIGKVKAFVWSTDTMIPLGKIKEAAIKTDSFNKTDKQTVAFFGDSTTHFGFIPWLEHLYEVRYPENKINFINKGIAGDTGTGMNSRIDWDLLNDPYTDAPDVVVAFNSGCNQYFSYYSDATKTQAERLAKVQEYVNALRDTVGIIKNQNNIEMILASHTLYDHGDWIVYDDYEGFNDAIKIVRDNQETIANEYDTRFVDIYTASNNITRQVREEKGNIPVFLSNDRIHPGENGKLMAASIFFMQMGNDSIVSKVKIDANNINNNSFINADVSDVNITSTGGTYTYYPNSLPIGVNSTYHYVENTFGFHITKMLNNEIIQVSSLESGNYNVSMDGALLGSFTNIELEQGINIASISNNPGQIVAQNVLSKCLDKGNLASQYRNIALAEQEIRRKAGLDPNDINQIPAIDQWIQEQLQKSTLTSTYRNAFLTYREKKSNQANLYVEIENLTSQIKVLSKTSTHTVSISIVQ